MENVPHDIAVAGVGYEDELSLWECLEDLVQQELADTQGCADIAEVQRARVERTTWVGLVDEVHIIAGDLFGGRRQVVEMRAWDAAGPVCIDVWHVIPLRERLCERIEQPFLWRVDLGHSQNVINVRDDGQAFRRSKIGCCVPVDVTLCVDVQALDIGGGIPGCETVGFNGNKTIKVALWSCRSWELDLLIAA